AGAASLLHPNAAAALGAPRLAALLLVQILPVLHPTVHKTHGGDPALRSSRRSAGVPTARTVRRGVERPGASPPSVRRWTFTTGCQVRLSSDDNPPRRTRNLRVLRVLRGKWDLRTCVRFS